MSVRVRFTAIRANARIIPSPEVYAALHEYTRDYCAALITEVSEYPAPAEPSPPHKPYARTFRLLSNWRLRDMSSGVGIQYQINNAVQDRWGRYYSGYVHGPRQASFHGAHGWKNLKDLLERPTFRAGAQRVMTEVVR